MSGTKVILRNIVGAFSDGAVLFPLLALLSMKAGFSGVTLLLTTGCAYIAAAVLFRVPMSVQPLKSIAVASIAIGATALEVRSSGLMIGVICAALALTHIDRFVGRVPLAVSHQLQVGLGVLLIMQGGALISFSMPGLLALGATALMVLWPEVAGVPVLGLLATVGLCIAVFSSGSAGENVATVAAPGAMRPLLVLGLIIPQFFLTMANSVLATRNVSERYFGAAASRVTIRRLLGSIGLGNIAVAAVGGMPFCHGSGGVTAHVRGGATKPWSTALMGIVLLALAFVQFASGSKTLIYPPLLVAPLLMATGVFHLQLAASTAKQRVGMAKLIAAAVVTIATKNLLLVLCAAVAFEWIERRNHDPASGSTEYS